MTLYMQKILKELRTKHKLSQEQVATIIGVSRPTYSAIEAGTQKLNTEEIQKLANLYGVGVNDLLSGHIPDIAKYKQMFLISEAESNHNEKLTTLTAPEVKLMQEIGTKWKDKKTKDIVNFTHNQLPYTLCRMEELIPYSLITQEDPGTVF